MIKLATVFSGIGAIEHALSRMNIEHKIVFACDNGDVDILSHKIENDVSIIREEINNLSDIINSIQVSKNKIPQEVLNFKNELSTIRKKFNSEVNKLKQLDLNFILILKNILEYVTTSNFVTQKRKSEYKVFINTINLKTNEDRIYYSLKATIDVINDFRRDNSITLLIGDLKELKFKSSDNICWNDIYHDLISLYDISEDSRFKIILKDFKQISESLSMLYEKINAQKISEEISSISGYQEKKHYIDNLYLAKKQQNKVKQSYVKNYKIDEDNFHWNVSFLDGKQYANKVDLFVGGSPCQSFSLVGKQRGLDDTRGTLFYEYARLIQEIRPKVFIYENVKAVLSNDNGKTWDTMSKVFTDLDYTWSKEVLNAKDFGIPQNRERIFVVGFRNDLILKKPFLFPNKQMLTKKMQDFLLDNVSGKYYLPPKGVAFVTNKKNLEKKYTQIDGRLQLCQKKNQQFNWHGDFIFVEENNDMEKTMQDLEKYFLSEKVKKYVLSSGTKGFYSKPKTDLEIARPLLTTMHKMHRAGVDNYVTTEGRLRKLTPRECLRLMGFCDSFEIVVSDTSMYQQAGNSIVVDVLIEIIKSIINSYPNLIEAEI